APQQGIFKGTAVPLNDLLLPFLAFRKGRPLGVRGHGPNGPRHRDLSGPIDKAVKPAASNILAPPEQGEKPNCGVAPTATQYPRQWYSRGGHDARRELRQGLALWKSC